MNFTQLWRYFKQIQVISGIQTEAILTNKREICNRFLGMDLEKWWVGGDFKRCKIFFLYM